MLKRNEFWSRVFTFVPTATKADGEEIDEKAFRTAIDYQIENGVHGVCIFGSTGGNGSFSDEEMKRQLRSPPSTSMGAYRWSQAPVRAPLRPVSRFPSTRRMSAAMRVMVLPVSYWPLTTDEVFEHYERVSKSIKIPICIYNNPWTTGVDMKPELLATTDQARQLQLHQGKHRRSHSHHRDPVADQRPDHADRGVGVEQLAGLHGRRVRVGAGLHEFPSRTSPCKFFGAAVQKRDAPAAQSIWDKLIPQSATSSAPNRISASPIRVSTFSGVPVRASAPAVAHAQRRRSRAAQDGTGPKPAQTTVDVGPRIGGRVRA